MCYALTYHHTTIERALRAIERERQAGAFDRALLWDCGQMGVITRFYSLYKPMRVPGERAIAYVNAVMNHPSNAPYMLDYSSAQRVVPKCIAIKPLIGA